MGSAIENTKNNFKAFYEKIKPYLGNAPKTGFTPVGTVISYMGTTAPDYYLICDGSVYNIVDYPELAKHIETNFGSRSFFGGDGTTTFAVPDLRGEFLRGTGTNSHTDQGDGGDVGEHQDGTEIPFYGLNLTGSTKTLFSGTNVSNKTSGNLEPLNVDSWLKVGDTDNGLYANFNSKWSNSGNYGTFSARPTNTSVLYCIAYKDIYISLDDNRPVQAAFDRWLRFDPSNKKGLIIKAGTNILKANGQYRSFHNDTAIDFSTTLTSTENGKDFFVYLNDDDSITCHSIKQNTGMFIGRFHTLCADAGANLTMKAPESPNSGLGVGQRYLVKSYKPEIDPDFYAFYNKTITAVSAGTPYDVITCEHPLKGYTAGDILPESVFCTTFYPDCLYEDAMVYDKNTDICVDVYLQSGTGHFTRSEYNATHTVSRQVYNHLGDMLSVGKQLLSDHEFTSIALGSNECTAIQGAGDKTTVGGHVDTASRRMLSAIGVEEACGYLWQWTREIGFNGQANWKTTDGKGSFGQEYGEPFVLLAGGDWVDSGSCGSRARNCSAVRSGVHANGGGRGCTAIVRSANAPKSEVISTSGGSSSEDYSTEEQVIGTWIDGKPLYKKTYYIASAISVGINSYTTVFTVPANFKTLVQMYGSCSIWNYLYFNPNNIGQFASAISGLNTIIAGSSITIKYTKTTD